MRRSFSIAILVAVFVVRPAFAGDLLRLPAAIQIATKASEGKYSIKHVVSVAKKCGVKVVVITDRDLMKWEYGLWPLRNIIRKKVETTSIFTYGIDRYLSEIEEAQKENPDMIIIAGTESAPYYFWEGHPIHGNLTIRDWHKHILTMGLNKTSDLENLPIAGNKRGFEAGYSLRSLWSLIWPILLILFGIFAANRKRIDYSDEYGRHYLSPRCRNCVAVGITCIVIGALFLINNFPYKEARFEPHRGSAGIAPYQNFIDYVSKRGGLTFWSHPEAEYVGREGLVRIDTREHSADLLQAQRYTGFAIFYEGYEKVGRPGGIWDEYLLDYCRGRVPKPIWIIGGMSYQGDNDLAACITGLKTVLLVPKFGRDEALDAMRRGSMYVARGDLSGYFRLDDFSVKDPASGGETASGGEVTVSGRPVIKIKGSFDPAQHKTFAIKVIMDGKVIDELEEEAPFDISYDARVPKKPGLSYYRIDMSTQGLQVVTNPIFVRTKAK